jgi:Spy/CpxP family protein refolding chaperone
MKRISIMLVAAMVIAVIFTSASFADPLRQERGRGRGEHMRMGKLLNDPEMIEKLALTPEQITALKKIHFDHQKKMITLRSHMQLKKLELKQLMDAENLDKNLIRKKVKEISAARGDLALEKVEMKLSAADVLSKDQLAKLKQMKRGLMKKKIIKRMECDKPHERHEKRMRIHRHHPGWQDMPNEEEVEKEIIIEEEE